MTTMMTNENDHRRWTKMKENRIVWSEHDDSNRNDSTNDTLSKEEDEEDEDEEEKEEEEEKEHEQMPIES